MMPHTFNSRTSEMNAEGSDVQGHPLFNGSLKAHV